MAALDELTAKEYEAARHDPEFRAELDHLLETYAGAAQPAHRGQAVRRAVRGRCARPAQARGPRPHRVAQDQQRAGPGAADQADGQDAGNRRDRRRPARRRDRHRRGAARPRLHGLHGRGRHPPSGAQRRADAHARRRGGPGQDGQPTLKDACNEAFRDWVASVDHTHYCIGSRRRPAPVPDDGPRLPAGHRRRGAPAGPRA